MYADIRKTFLFQEKIRSEASMAAEREITRVVSAAVFSNPFAGRPVADLSDLYEIGEAIGAILTSEMLTLFSRPIESYGKAALVGVNGDLEHGHALIHPRLGRAMRSPIGGGAAIIPSMAKVCTTGATADIPLGHKDDAWSFSHFDCMTVVLADAPRPDELALIVALADGGRPSPRIGDRRAA